MTRLLALFWTACLLAHAAAADGAAADGAAADDEREAFFENKVRPVLVERCFECHGRKSEENGLRVDSRDALVRGGESGAAIVPGKAGDSLLVKAIRRADDQLQMPPKAPLPDRAVSDIVRWIDEGAAWPAYKVTYRYAGRDFRLTDVAGNVVNKIFT